MHSQKQYLRTLLYVCKLKFSNFPSYYFPVYILMKLFEEYHFKFRTRKLDYQLLAIPNYYFDFLCKDHLIKSEHTVFLNPKVYRHYIFGNEKVNFLNLQISERNKTKQVTETEKLMKNVLNMGEAQTPPTSSNSNKMSSVFQVFSLESVPMNKVFMKENSYYNLLDKYKLNENCHKKVFANLNMIAQSQTLPQIATKANIFLISTPFDIPSTVVDEVLKEFFRRPQLLYRNHTYLVHLDENTLGSFLYCEHFQLFSQLKKLYFKCVHIESQNNSFEMCGVVMKNLTTLHQTTSIKYCLPKQLYDSYFFVTNYPLGLKKYCLELKEALKAFIETSVESKSMMKSQKMYPLFQLIGDRGSGKREVVRAVADSLGIHLYNTECSDIMTNIASQTETKLLQALNRSTVCQPSIICFKDFELFGLNNEGHEDVRLVNFFIEEVGKLFSKQEFDNPIFIIALVNGKQPVKSIKLNHLFLESIDFESPEKEDRFRNLIWMHQREIFDQKCRKINEGEMQNYISINMYENLENDVKILKKMSDLTQGFLFGDLTLLYEKSVLQLLERERFCLDENVFDEKLAEIKKTFGASIGTPHIPKVLWDDIGGLAKLKTEIQNSIGLPLKFSHLMGKNMRRSGILLYGPPGTGKTLIAKAVATECNLSFLSVQGPELLNMYVGQSEQNVRDVFSRARSAAPCVIFLDELDSLAPNRGVAGDSGGVMDRVVSQLLSEMDGYDTDPHKPVFILAATNRPDLIDPALLRPGRFDKILYVGPCTSPDDKELVLKAQTKKFNLKKGLNLKKIVELIPMDVTGSDLYSICSNAWLSAVRRHIESFNSGNVPQEQMIADNVMVNFDDFKKSMKNFVSSLNQADMDYFNSMKVSYS